MLNGKFYTGLTEHQMNRSSGPNRQKTNFFWPTEEDKQPVSSVSTRSKKSDVERKYNESNDVVHKPKELYTKQLSSKIQFYDNVDASKTPPSVRRQNQRRESNRIAYEKNNNILVNGPTKPNTFESKIEFFDYVDTAKPKEPIQTKVNVTKPLPEKKKISFDDYDDIDKTKKGILKNRDVRMRVEHNVPIDVSDHRSFNRNNGTKLKLSKSMENVAKGKFTIHDDYNDRYEKFNEMTNQLNKLNINNSKEKINLTRRNDPRYEIDIDYNQKGFDEQSKYNIPPVVRRNERQSQRNSYHGMNNDNFETFEESYSSTKNYDNNGYNMRRKSEHYDHNDRNDRSNLRKHFHTKNNTYNDRLQANAIDETDEFREETATKKTIIPESTSRYRNEPRNERTERVINIKRSSTINGANDYPNEARRRAHTHLHSNIFFDDARLQPLHQRPLSIRESAVTRVGVGLPNI